MAPSAGQLLNYICGRESSVSLPFVLSSAALLSVLLLLFCSFFKKIKTLDFTENKKRSEGSVPTAVAVKMNVPTEQRNRAQNEDTEGDPKQKTGSKGVENVDGFRQSKLSNNKSPDIKDRALPLPPQSDAAGEGQSSGSSADDPLYDFISEEEPSVSQLQSPEPCHNNVLPGGEDEDDAHEAEDTSAAPVYSVIQKNKTVKAKQGGARSSLNAPTKEHTLCQQVDDGQLGRSETKDATQAKGGPPVSKKASNPLQILDKVSMMYNKAKWKTSPGQPRQPSARSSASDKAEEPPPLPDRAFDPEEELQ
ncbi:uncharacterized protein LOC128484180 [Spea bombifrons]|uniref:uncharacterized protein LOC128484180 n=1 Tax=Spea bombifrons TaxID=233779 RepID=UPI0023499DA8|nr:uncharacterized protein LOC128484180 [Spea bombifrons]